MAGTSCMKTPSDLSFVLFLHTHTLYLFTLLHSPQSSTVFSHIIATQRWLILTCRLYCYVMLQGKRNGVDMIKLRMLRSGDYPGML